ncbi:hypothetical protein QW131_04950 [Roseibium salinum]|nr:hypothetical protein [Roseibium salinum]
MLVNGAPLPEKALRRQLIWQPEAPGFASVTILDAHGASARVTVLLR